MGKPGLGKSATTALASSTFRSYTPIRYAACAPTASLRRFGLGRIGNNFVAGIYTSSGLKNKFAAVSCNLTLFKYSPLRQFPLNGQLVDFNSQFLKSRLLTSN